MFFKNWVNGYSLNTYRLPIHVTHQICEEVWDVGHLPSRSWRFVWGDDHCYTEGQYSVVQAYKQPVFNSSSVTYQLCDPGYVNFSVPAHLFMSEIRTIAAHIPPELLWRFWDNVRCLEQCLAWNKPSINVSIIIIWNIWQKITGWN